MNSSQTMVWLYGCEDFIHGNASGEPRGGHWVIVLVNEAKDLYVWLNGW